MFARKPKTSDVQSSLQRFSDLQRETSSRAKHFKLALESLSVQVLNFTSLENFETQMDTAVNR